MIVEFQVRKNVVGSKKWTGFPFGVEQLTNYITNPGAWLGRKLRLNLDESRMVISKKSTKERRVTLSRTKNGRDLHISQLTLRSALFINSKVKSRMDAPFKCC